MRKLMNFAMLSAIATVSFFGCNPKEDEKDPTAAFTVSPEKTVYEDGEEITFTDASVANSGTITQWSWDFGDGTPKGTTATVKHTYKSKNTFTVKLTVVNSSNKQASATKTIQQKGANQAPAANFVIKVGTQTQAWALAGDEVSFENTSTDPDVAEGDVLTYSWDFGDGSALSTEKDPKHTYAAVTNNTNYTVKLVVTDSKSATNTKEATLQLRLIAPIVGLNIIASYEMGDIIFLASPAVDNNAVYMTSNAGKLVALNKADLIKKWEFDVKNANNIGAVDATYRQASSPAIDKDGTIYIGAGHASSGTQVTNGYLYAVDLNGSKKWQYELGNARYVNYAPPAIDEVGDIYIGGRGTGGPLTKVSKTDGTKVWEIAPGGGVVGQITMNTITKHLYVACGGNGIRSFVYETTPPNNNGVFNRRFGANIYNSGQVTVDPAKGVFYACGKDLGNSASEGTADGIVMAFPTSITGTAAADYLKDKMWEFKVVGANPEKMGVTLNSDGSVLYVAGFDNAYYAANPTLPNKGKIYAVNTSDGLKKWDYETEGLVGSIPAVDAEGNIHFGDQKGWYYILKSDGTIKYKIALFTEVSTQPFIYSSPVIDSNGDIYIGVGTKLVKLSTGVLGYPSSSPWPMRGQNNFRTGAK